LASEVVTVNDTYRATLIKRTGVAAERISVVRNGPDERDAEHAADVARSAEQFRVGYIGICAPQDGVDGLVRAMRIVRHDLGRRDIGALIVGDGSEGPRLRAMSAQLGLEEAIEFTGFLPHDRAMERISEAQLGCVPDPSNSYNDRTTMTKLLDYMALGLPVVAFDLPEHRISADGAARYVPANDERALAEAIVALADDPVARARMGEIGRARIRDGLAWRYSVPPLLALYDRLAARASAAQIEPA
jgi:glycosyltransferase involved in cell wall biosynthesis